jgi:hypothetical protein
MHDERDIEWMMAPLDKVPLRTISRLTAKLKSAKDPGQKSLGVFLDRVQAISQGGGRPSGANRPAPANLSSLRDLRD